ncbi:MAG TPA: NADPH-dependent FMN reductase [Thermoanaerobaculia bacterium]|nr:NADPH-dependent FMN reductase [Thermoanaerobaculia bacterium]
MNAVGIVAISGSVRAQSSNAALLRAAARVSPAPVVFYDGLESLPQFNPDLDGEGSVPPPAVAALRRLLIDSDAVLISSPEYAHGVPGALKNMLDWLVSVGELVEKRVALVNAAPVGGQFAQAQLLETLRTMNWNVVMEACRMEPFVPRKISGDVTDEAVLDELRKVMEVLPGR